MENLLIEEINLTMVKIPAGSFLMGSAENEPGRSEAEGPQHGVTLAAFWMAKTPITHAQWREVASWQKVELDLDPDPSHFKGDQRPVESVSWEDAIEFCRRLSQRTGRRYTLPSEAQWEYACRAGTTTPFYCGSTISTKLSNYNGYEGYGDGAKGEFRQQTTYVASYPANPWGLHDMHGNVWEWCADQWHGNYEGAPEDGSAWVDEEAKEVKNLSNGRLLRGGSWDVLPRYCRSAYRSYYLPDYRFLYVGFRVCCLP
jgi:formylglycine-generating enzyme required for sulfatase activity